MDEMRKLRTTTACMYMHNARALAMILWGRARADLPEQQRILRRMTHRLRWQSCSMQIAYVPLELNPAGPISKLLQGHMVVLARARHQCFRRTAQLPPWGVVEDRDRQVWVGYQWGG